MEELKSLFGDEALNYDAFEKKLAEAGDTIKLANLATHGYVERDIYEKQKAKLEEYKSKLKDYETSENDITSLRADYEDISTKYKDLLAKQDLAEKMSIIKDANVAKEFADYVYTKVSAQVTEEKDFQKALSEFLKDNSQYLNASKGTFVDLQNGDTAPKSGNDLMNKLIRGK